MTRFAVLALLCLACLVSVSVTSASPAPSQASVWAKVKTQWTAQAQTAGTTLTCSVGQPPGFNTGKTRTWCAIGDVSGFVYASVSGHACWFYVWKGSRSSTDSYKLDVCKPGWTARVPSLLSL